MSHNEQAVLGLHLADSMHVAVGPNQEMLARDHRIGNLNLASRIASARQRPLGELVVLTGVVTLACRHDQARHKASPEKALRI